MGPENKEFLENSDPNLKSKMKEEVKKQDKIWAILTHRKFCKKINTISVYNPRHFAPRRANSVPK